MGKTTPPCACPSDLCAYLARLLTMAFGPKYSFAAPTGAKTIAVQVPRGREIQYCRFYGRFCLFIFSCFLFLSGAEVSLFRLPYVVQSNKVWTPLWYSGSSGTSSSASGSSRSSCGARVPYLRSFLKVIQNLRAQASGTFLPGLQREQGSFWHVDTACLPRVSGDVEELTPWTNWQQDNE